MSGFLERAAEMLDLPADAVAGVSSVEIIGNREMLVENHRGIVEYTDTEIKINTDKAILRIMGSGLAVTSMNASQLKLTGVIDTVQFVNI